MKTVDQNRIAHTTLVVLSLTLLLLSTQGNAQSFRRKKDNIYIGLGASFGMRTLSLKSDIAKLHNLNVVQGGGQISAIAGYRAVRVKVGLAGFYYSASSVAQTTDMFQADLMCNFYPLMMITKKASLIEPYLVGGAVYSKLKFYGYYGMQEPPKNFSTSEQPFVGTINQSQLAFGGGFVVKLHDDEYNFVHLFSEVRYGVAMAQRTQYEILEHTKVGNQVMAGVGVRFGRKL